MCELFKSDRSQLKKILTRTWNCLSLQFFANFNTWAQEILFHPLNIEDDFSFIPSLKNAPNVALGPVNWFSFETVAFVLQLI